MSRLPIVKVQVPGIGGVVSATVKKVNTLQDGTQLLVDKNEVSHIPGTYQVVHKTAPEGGRHGVIISAGIVKGERQRGS